MKARNHKNDEAFCDWISIRKIRKQIRSVSSDEKEKLGFLILSGSFNPIHTQHVLALDMVREFLTRRGWAVVGGFLAPSSDMYVAEKLGSDALSFEQRRRLCQTAVRGSDWIGVCTRGEFSSNRVCRAIKGELAGHVADIRRGRALTGFEIMGTDTAARLFKKIVTENRNHLPASGHRGRRICCIRRIALDCSAERMKLESDIVADAADLGIGLIVLPAALVPISSNAIRNLIVSGNWETLKRHRWLHPAVFKALKKNNPANVLDNSQSYDHVGSTSLSNA